MIVRIFLALIVFFAISAQALDVYVIKNIKIYANNKSASIARNEAVESGQLKAFRGLLKLHYPEALAKVDKMDKEDIYSLVESYELSDEKRSATNYYAKLNVRFSVAHVDKMMQNMGVSFSQGNHEHKLFEEKTENSEVAAVKENSVQETANLTTLVVPIFIQNGKDYWFDDANPWLNTWQSKKLGQKFILPEVDLEDLSIINQNILNKNLIDLASLFEKYGVNNIALYTLEDVEGGMGHNVTLKVNYINKYHYSWQGYHFPDQSGADLSQILNQAYSQVQEFKFDSNLDTCCKITDSLTTVTSRRLMFEYQITKLSDWMQLEQMMKSINYISDLSIDEISANKYKFSFMCNISIDDLKGIFAKYNLQMREEEGRYILEAA